MKPAVFVKGLDGTDPIMEDGRVHIALIGRSNVGKSSLLNSLTGVKDLARSSPLPGKTREINVYLMDKQTYLVDLPGYGYSRMEAREREHLRRLIFWYLETPVPGRIIVLIIDAQVGPTMQDLEMLQYLREEGHEVIVVANKIDKVKQGVRHKQLKKIQDQIQAVTIIPYSAQTDEGRGELLRRLTVNR